MENYLGELPSRTRPGCRIDSNNVVDGLPWASDDSNAVSFPGTIAENTPLIRPLSPAAAVLIARNPRTPFIVVLPSLRPNTFQLVFSLLVALETFSVFPSACA